MEIENSVTEIEILKFELRNASQLTKIYTQETDKRWNMVYKRKYQAI